MSHERRLQPAVEVQWAKRVPQPLWIRRGKVRGAFAAGLKYERQVKDYLVECTLGKPHVRIVESPWYQFQCAQDKPRWCQPDVLLINQAQGVGIIVEVKLKHNPEAWWQLREVYRPVLRVACPQIQGWGLLEVCHWHDPDTRFPQQYDFTNDPLSIRSAARVSVHIYNPRRARLQSARGRDGASGGQAAGAGGQEEGAEQLLAPAQP